MKDRPTVYLLIDLEDNVVHGVYMEKADAEAEIKDREDHDKAMGYPPSDYTIETWRVI